MENFDWDKLDLGEIETNKPNFNKVVTPLLDKFQAIPFTEEELEPLNKFVEDVVIEKLNESHYKIDSGSLKKRYQTGFMGEMAISKILEKNTVDWAIGNSKIFNKSDLSALGKNVGIKTVEWGKFPIVHKNPKRPEIICIRKENTVYVCGLATIAAMQEYSSDELIKSQELRARNVKTGFYGFEQLKQLKKK